MSMRNIPQRKVLCFSDAYQNYSDNDYKVNIDSYTKFNEDGSNQEVKENLTVRRFHAKYHNEVAILKIGIVDKTFADRLLLGFMGGYEYKTDPECLHYGLGVWCTLHHGQYADARN